MILYFTNLKKHFESNLKPAIEFETTISHVCIQIRSKKGPHGKAFFLVFDNRVICILCQKHTIVSLLVERRFFDRDSASLKYYNFDLFN